MNIDFIKELGYKALDSRLKRISDRMSHDARQFYKDMEIDVESNWYLVFMLLQKRDQIPIKAIAEALGYTHPSVSVIAKKMESKGCLHIKKDNIDKRKQLVSLSKKGLKILPELEKIWHSCERAILKLLNEDLAVLRYFDHIDTALESVFFQKRFKQKFIKSASL